VAIENCRKTVAWSSGLKLDRIVGPENVPADMRAEVNPAKWEDAQHMFVQDPVIAGDGTERQRNAG
jgi:hypothetical protein